MTQFILDDHLDPDRVRDPIARWTTVRFLRDVRPREVIKDERVPVLLRTLRTPTFVTIDEGFWSNTWRDRHYCVLHFAMRDDEQRSIPVLLRRLLRLPEFRTRAARMGKVTQVSRDHVRWYEFGDETEHTFHWESPPRRRMRR